MAAPTEFAVRTITITDTKLQKEMELYYTNRAIEKIYNHFGELVKWFRSSPLDLAYYVWSPAITNNSNSKIFNNWFLFESITKLQEDGIYEVKVNFNSSATVDSSKISEIGWKVIRTLVKRYNHGDQEYGSEWSAQFGWQAPSADEFKSVATKNDSYWPFESHIIVKESPSIGVDLGQLYEFAVLTAPHLFPELTKILPIGDHDRVFDRISNVSRDTAAGMEAQQLMKLHTEIEGPAQTKIFDWLRDWIKGDGIREFSKETEKQGVKCKYLSYKLKTYITYRTFIFAKTKSDTRLFWRGIELRRS